MKIVYYPKDPTENAFTSIVQSGMKLNGCEILSIEDFFDRGKSEPTPVCLNWFDEIHARNSFFSFWAYLRQRRLIGRIISNGGRIVYVVHNCVPHDTVLKGDLFFSHRLRELLSRSAGCIVILCDETRNVLEDQLGSSLYSHIEPQILKAPIPTYTGFYPHAERSWRSEHGISPDKFLFLFSGFIRPYKGVELIVDVAQYFMSKGYDAQFVIAGRCSSKDYQRKVSSMASELDNLRLSFGFVSNEDLGSFIEAADALILPLDQSSLNSSTCYLAFSYGRTVVCSAIGTIREFDSSLTYSYECGSAEAQKAKLIVAAERAYLDWAADREGFSVKGRILKRIVDEENSVEKIGALYRAAAEMCLV